MVLMPANMVVTVWSSEISAALVDSEGQNANWLDRFGLKGVE